MGKAASQRSAERRLTGELVLVAEKQLHASLLIKAQAVITTSAGMCLDIRPWQGSISDWRLCPYQWQLAFQKRPELC